MPAIKTIGILGAGKLGVTIAQLAIAAGYKVYIAGSGSPEKIALSTKIITPGATATTANDAAKKAEIVFLAIPLGKFRSLDASLFEGKVVIDGMNHWPEVDGPLDEILTSSTATSVAVQEHLADARVVKALNHMGYHHLRDEARESGAEGRKAIAVAGDDEKSIRAVMEFVDSLGFDPLFVGTLSDSRVLEAGSAVFGANVNYEELNNLVGVAAK